MTIGKRKNISKKRVETLIRVPFYNFSNQFILQFESNGRN